MDYIDVTDVDLHALAAKAYEMSEPKSAGWLDYRPGPIPALLEKRLVSPHHPVWPINLDYVLGRAVKLQVERHSGGLYLPMHWPDHTIRQYNELLAHVGIHDERLISEALDD